MKTTDAVKALVEQKINALGYELVDIEFKKEQTDWVLTLYIDKPGGIMLDDCETVSRAIEPILDETDPIEQSYFLSVSSPGLDRPIKTAADYKRNMGKDIVVKLYAQVEKKKEFKGSLRDFNDKEITLACDDGVTRVFLLKDVAQAKPYIDFNTNPH